MKAFLGIAIILLCVVSSPAQEPEATPTPGQEPLPGLRARVYDIAGVLGNDGFKARDGAWVGQLEGGKAQRLSVNLFAGNQYWFFAATSEPKDVPMLVLRDSAGRTAATIRHVADGVAALGVTAPATGTYTIEIKDSSPRTQDFSLLYFFK